MADAPQPSIDTKETDKKMRERVDKLIGQATSESSGSIKLNGRSLEYIVNAAFLPVVAEGLD
ncbi:MAG TPA: peptidase S10, partial [Casimicrobiaceae bacterium]|nr:peptidase S10 [Casimicrobiaceae bacterium]